MMNTPFQHHSLAGVRVFAGVFAGLLLLAPLQVWADRPASSKSADPTVVYLTASWCGTCRELYPAVKRAVDAADGGTNIVTLDVDSPNAPNQASTYGITIAGSDLPQVYLYNNGQSRLLFSGKGYKFGKSKAVEEQIRQQLQR